MEDKEREAGREAEVKLAAGRSGDRWEAVKRRSTWMGRVIQVWMK